MKLKSTLWMMLILLCLCLCGCSGSGDNDTQDTTLGQDAVKVGNTKIALNDDMASLKDALGEPVDYNESKSCLYDGYDKTYTYENVIIVTYPKDGKEYIASITVLSKDVEAGCGAKVGDSTETLKELFGESDLTMNPNFYMYETSDYGIACYLDGNTVTEIEIYTITE